MQDTSSITATEHDAYARRVAELEAEGLTTSDAQAAADAEVYVEVRTDATGKVIGSRTTTESGDVIREDNMDATTVTTEQVIEAVKAATDEPVQYEHTGGGVATIYVGEPNAEGRYLLAIGPGSIGDGTFDLRDLYVGPDDDGESTPAATTSLASITEAVGRVLEEVQNRSGIEARHSEPCHYTLKATRAEQREHFALVKAAGAALPECGPNFTLDPERYPTYPITIVKPAGPAIRAVG